MNITIPFIAITLVAVLVITLYLLFLAIRKGMVSKNIRLSIIAFFFVVVGLFFAEGYVVDQSRLVGYSLIVAGLLIAVVDIFRVRRL